ncbi:energy-coupling factor ABC transporter ATP-binding protein [Saccharothrix yanglingensis]|uniref:Cobalt ABC transporter ATP-binding protein n=1 Tax=Saccharothrix yanglingensis TaxID=659496 RepID=A0ABU0X4N8_9PSEU|nr:ABC transporter ATP-binding protein [Saccharothrix yanglingensis]MDQ2586668.1 cobalt ABC transporter ATP-binding protein [Saccharothrix yanglingensis]
MIELEDVSFTYPTGSEPALSHLSLSVPAGQVCGVVGANGSGKSTLAGVIADMAPRVTGGELTGSVAVAGRSTAGTAPREPAPPVGLVMQNPFTQMSGAKFTVREELAFGLENLGVPRAEMVRRIDRVVELLGLGRLTDRPPFELSGGQQQMVVIGSILVMEPTVLVLDEPTSQLDPDGVALVFEALRALEDDDVTVVLVEHRVEQLAELADRVVVLDRGRVVLDDVPRAVLTHPALDGLGVARTRYTEAAKLAAAESLWPPSLPLPVLLPDAAEGFAEVLAPTRQELP